MTESGRRFDLSLIDPVEPFEMDEGNIPHLAKHPPFTHEDALDAWTFGDPLFFPAKKEGPAHWLMVGEVAGEGLVLVPLAPANDGRAHHCRPVGIYRPSDALAARYREGTHR